MGWLKSKKNKQIIAILLLIIIIFFIFLVIYKSKESNKKEKFKIYINENKQKPKHNRIDVVYTWVDYKDKKWKNLRGIYSKHVENKPRESNNKNRFYNIDELKYSLRSIFKYGSWLNKIFIVVHDGQRPKWLKNSKKIKIIEHSEIYDNLNHLPTFNSQSIECHIDKIKDLSDYFLYFNDDMFLGNNLKYYDLIDKKTNKPYFLVDEYSALPHFFKRDPITGYEHAWNNINNLLKENYNIKNINTMIPIHQARLYNKNFIKLVKKKFKNYFERTSKSRFRSKDDISPLGLVSMYGLYNKFFVMKLTLSTYYLRECENLNKSLIKKKLKELKMKRPIFFCINSINNKNKKLMKQFFEDYYPNKCMIEK